MFALRSWLAGHRRGLLGVVAPLCLVVLVGLGSATLADAARSGGALAATSDASRMQGASQRAARHHPKKRAAPRPRPLPGVVLGLGALFTTQFDGSRYAASNCTMAAGAMLFEVQTGRPASGAQLRAWSRSTRGDTGLGELRHAFARHGQRLMTRYDMRWARFFRLVRRDRSAVVLGWYGNLPGRYVLQPGYRTAHSVFVLGYSRHARGGQGAFYVMDPLGTGSYQGQWWPRSVLHAFGWSGRPGHIGGSRRSFFGDVALQGHASGKHRGRSTPRPLFQGYWASAKALIERAHHVTVRSPEVKSILPDLRGSILRVKDAHLTMIPRKAARKDRLSWPLAVPGHTLAGFRRRHPELTVAARPRTDVVAAAGGRVVFRGDDPGDGKVWLAHGKRLFTLYAGLGQIRVEPGEWVVRGAVLGRLGRARAGHHPALGFRVVVARQPWSHAGLEDPLRFLALGSRRPR